jgi:IclR family pca regulon transcriptional regulator
MPRVSGRQVSAGLDGESREPVPHLRERLSWPMERGLAVLACFSAGRPVLSVADIAEELGVSRSTSQRDVLTLTRLGYLVQGAQRKYRLGMPVVDLGMSALNSTSLREHAWVPLEDLRRRTGIPVSIAVLDGPEALVIECLGSRRCSQEQIDLGREPGSRLPLYCTALGKLLLAHLSEQAQRSVFAEMTLRRCTSSTITSKSVLRAELQSIRGHSLACAEEEWASGWSSIAAPVRSDSREVVAAVGMDAHSSMIPIADFLDVLGPHLIATADVISARLGYRRDDEMLSPGVNGLGSLGSGVGR